MNLLQIFGTAVEKRYILMQFVEKSNYGFEDLVEIMKLLRSKEGCPWDREQNHMSIRQNLIEETYEAIEAIDTEDTELLKEELGDVMLQVVFHAQLEDEVGSFDINDVCDGICKKLIVRHPHIFANVIADNSDEVLKNWDAIKMRTKAQKTQADSIDSVAKSLPSLMRSQKIQHKAAKVGFDWDNVDGAIEKVSEELDELKTAIKLKDEENQYEELGDLLFAVVNISRFINVDSEKALYSASDKFSARFRVVERLASEQNIDIKTADISVLDELWNQAKIEVKKNSHIK